MCVSSHYVYQSNPGENIPEPYGEGGDGQGESEIKRTFINVCPLQVKLFLVVTLAYLIFWGPLFAVSKNTYLSKLIHYIQVTLINWDWSFEDAKQSVAHEVGNTL